MIQEIAFLTYGTAGVAVGLFAVLLLTAWRGRRLGGLMLFAAIATAVWAGAIASFAASGNPVGGLIGVFEAVRNLAWLLFLRGILAQPGREGRGVTGQWPIRILFAAGVMGVLALAVGVDSPYLQAATSLWFLAAAVIGLGYVEHVFRGTSSAHRWRVKLLCIGLGLQLAYDFFLYAHALLFGQIDSELWAARGAVQALVVPCLAVTAARNPDWSVEIFVSRQVVFGSLAVVGAGIYLLVMSAAGYYLRIKGGEWGRVAEVGFLCGAMALLAILFTSHQLRVRTKVFLAKHFFKNKYDYRLIWLAFTQALAESQSDVELRTNIIKSTAELIDSPGGALWIGRDDGAFVLAASWGEIVQPQDSLPSTDPTIQFLKDTGWVIYLDEVRQEPADYHDVLSSPLANGMFGVIIPLNHQGEHVGVLGLMPPKTPRSFNWEDSDLLKTVGQQAAGYLALLRLSEALTDARQFDAFNRLSSYVVHDLKNLVAQLALVVSNSERHLDNPAFVKDAIGTVANATDRMRRLLEQLRKGRLEETSAKFVNVGRVIAKCVAERSVDNPPPVVGRLEEGLVVNAEPERLQNVLTHLIQNAQEATPVTGRVSVDGFCSKDGVTIEVRDTGCGMDSQFIATRLFRPFETTKGNAGMGIGVYEAREFVTLWGGEISVESEVGVGTLFRIWLPSGSDMPVRGTIELGASHG